MGTVDGHSNHTVYREVTGHGGVLTRRGGRHHVREHSRDVHTPASRDKLVNQDIAACTTVTITTTHAMQRRMYAPQPTQMCERGHSRLASVGALPPQQAAQRCNRTRGLEGFSVQQTSLRQRYHRTGTLELHRPGAATGTHNNQTRTQRLFSSMRPTLRTARRWRCGWCTR